MRVQVVGADRWAAQGLAVALEGGVAAPGLSARPSTIADALPEGEDAPEVLVAIGLRGEVARTLIDRLPARMPLLWLGEPPPYALQTAMAGERPFAFLPTQTDAARLHAAIVALALGLGVYDAAAAATQRPAPVAAGAEEWYEALTPREIEVFELLAKGLGNREIAGILGMSNHTAKFHVAQILEKTGSATRTEAVRQGLRLGWVGL